MEIPILSLLIMILTIALVTGVSTYLSRSVRSVEGYTLGGRQSGVPLVAGSIAGACIGGGATVGTAQLASIIGLSAWWFTLGAGISLIIMALFYARPLRSASLETISQYLELSYGKEAGAFASLASSLGIFFSAVASCLPGIYILSHLLNISSLQAALLLLFLVAVYGFFGGMKSAGIGGILKMAIIWISLFVTGISVCHSFQASPELLASLPDTPWFSLFGNGVENAMANLFSLIVGILCTQTYIQAIFSASSPRTAAVGALAAALIIIPVGLPCVMIGMYMHAAHPEVSPILVLPTYLLHYQPLPIGSIAMGGILLSLISSISGLSLGIGTMLSQDILSHLFPVDNSHTELLRTRIVVLGVVILASAVSIINEDSQVLFWNYMSMALRGGGIFLPLTLAVFRPRAIAPHWALLSMISSTATAIAASFFKLSVPPLFLGLGISFALLLTGLMHHKWIQKKTEAADAAIRQ